MKGEKMRLSGFSLCGTGGALTDMAMEYFCCYHSYARKLAKLSDQEVGRLFRALLGYSEHGEAPELAGRESVAFDFIADDIDRAKAAYEAKCEQNRENGKKGAPPSAPERPRTPPKDKDKDKDKTKSKEKDLEAYASCAEPRAASAPPPAIMLPLNDGTEYAVTVEQCQEWAGLYPAVDVIQQLRNMRGWLIGNSKNRKTRSGIVRFITGWLAKEQNRGPSRQSDGARAGGEPPSGGNHAWMKKYIQGWDDGGG